MNKNKLTENSHFIFEDLSGKNVMIDKNFNIYLADVDSFTYYGNKRCLKYNFFKFFKLLLQAILMFYFLAF